MKRFLIGGTFSDDQDIEKKSEIAKIIASKLFANTYNGGSLNDKEKALSMIIDYDLIIFINDDSTEYHDLVRKPVSTVVFMDIAPAAVHWKNKGLVEVGADKTYLDINNNLVHEFFVETFDAIDDAIKFIDKL